MPEYLKSHIVYEFYCPACNNTCIGKTDQNFGTRVQEHSNLDVYMVNLHSFPPNSNSVEFTRAC